MATRYRTQILKINLEGCDMDMELWKIGSEIKLRRPGCDVPKECIVTGIQIFESGVQYQVVYWAGETRFSVWVDDCEVYSGTHKKVMGFQIGNISG